MSDTNIIHGFQLTLSGAELIEMCQKKKASLNTRLGQLEEALSRVANMAPEDRALAGLKTRGGDMADEVKGKIREAKADLKFFSFAVEHLEPESTYRLSYESLRPFGITLSRRY